MQHVPGSFLMSDVDAARLRAYLLKLKEFAGTDAAIWIAPIAEELLAKLSECALPEVKP